MLELNKWFFVQLANFLILLVLLNIIIFKPLLQLFKERDDRTKGFLDEARRMNEEKDSLLSQIGKKISKASEEAKKIREQLHAEGIKSNKEILELAHKETAEMNKQARRHIEAEMEKAKKRLRDDIKVFSDMIVERLIGV